jgi:integrase/recombinase XerD
MKKKVVLKRIFHRDQWRLAIIFDYDEKLKEIVRSINGTVFSATHRCFLIDDTEENFRLVFRMLRDDADIDISLLVGGYTVPDLRNSDPGIAYKQCVSKIRERSAGENDEVVAFNKTIKEIVPDDKDDQAVSGYKGNSGFGPVEFRITEREGLLVIRFLGRYDPDWIDEMKSYGRCFYDSMRREWLLTWSKLTCDSLADYFSVRGIRVSVKRQVVTNELSEARKATGDEVRNRELTSAALNGLDSLAMYLDENRYSSRTRESYLSMLDFFFRYFSPKDPADITEDEISLFIYDFIIRLGYSAAYQNQMVSAIKTFYTISGKGRVDPRYFERPRRRRALPKVFSKDEVSRILSSPRNIKHKLLLWMIYSCGLRRSEATNLRISDLDRERNLLHIREGKGGVDRIVPVPGKVWEKINEYVSSYSPRIYLFEGQTGGKYSSESVYRVFKDALWRAGIRKDVGVHSLRHSYATHLHESGLDIRYIQELLGHKSTRTTEIYTHVSRRNLVAVRSPIEDLDVK